MINSVVNKMLCHDTWHIKHFVQLDKWAPQHLFEALTWSLEKKKHKVLNKLHHGRIASESSPLSLSPHVKADKSVVSVFCINMFNNFPDNICSFI